MNVSRDSILWWLGIAGAILAYLSQSASPIEWGYPDWIKFAAVMVGIISAKLATSPLAGKNDQQPKDTTDD
jgi:hypothetical protein